MSGDAGKGSERRPERVKGSFYEGMSLVAWPSGRDSRSEDVRQEEYAREDGESRAKIRSENHVV